MNTYTTITLNVFVGSEYEDNDPRQVTLSVRPDQSLRECAREYAERLSAHYGSATVRVQYQDGETIITV